jgi:HTH-type transcriptional regulator/antitoxin HigA
MEQDKKISSEIDYSAVMKKIEALMAKGSDKVSKEELAEIRGLALAAQAWEQQKYTISAPATLTGMIEWRMYELKLRQKDLAKKLKVSDAKLSMIMNGRQKPDVNFLKAVHKELQVDAGFILEHA